MLTRMKIAVLSNTKLAVCAILMLCILYIEYKILLKLQEHILYNVLQSSKTFIGNVQGESIYIGSKENEDRRYSQNGVNRTTKYSTTPMTKMEIYLRDRLSRIKLSCGDVCETRHYVGIDSKFPFGN